MPYTYLDPQKLKMYPVSRRKSKTGIQDIAIDPDAPPPKGFGIDNIINETADRILAAKEKSASIILAYGAHLVKNGLAPVVLKMMEHGWITHTATQGAGCIHDWEFAWLGRSEEDVRENVASGTFGTWEETGKYINLAVTAGAIDNMGYGESVGALIFNQGLKLPSREKLWQRLNETVEEPEKLPAIAELYATIVGNDLPPGFHPVPHPFRRYSILAAAYQKNIPCTIHPGIGYDIIYNNPWANGGALGRAAHIDFKIMARSVSYLSGGVFLSIGSAIMAPQVFEKALSFANNILLQRNEKIHDFYILVNDLQKSGWDWTKGEPPKFSPDYYMRFLKSFYRMGGEVRYAAADNRELLPRLYHVLKKKTGETTGLYE